MVDGRPRMRRLPSSIIVVAFLAVAIFSGGAWRVCQWMSRPSSDGTPARLWSIIPLFVAMVFGSCALIELLGLSIARERRDWGIWLEDVAQRGAMLFVGMAWVVSWQQLVPTSWSWLWPVLLAAIGATLVTVRRDGWTIAMLASGWIVVGIVLCARFIPWWTRGTPMYIAWQALVMSIWTFIMQVVLERLSLGDAGILFGRAAVWWGNVTA